MTLELELSFQNPESKILEAKTLNSRLWKAKILNSEYRKYPKHA